jgi:glycosyltransferase involved in cell wall biosynthesis
MKRLADGVVMQLGISRQALLQQNVPAEKIAVPVVLRGWKFEIRNSKFKTNSPFRVLFLGQVILRKGIQYLLAAARQLEKENIQFDVVGPIGISETAIKSAPSNVIFHGRTNRDQAAIVCAIRTFLFCRQFPTALRSRNSKRWRTACRSSPRRIVVKL